MEKCFDAGCRIGGYGADAIFGELSADGVDVEFSGFLRGDDVVAGVGPVAGQCAVFVGDFDHDAVDAVVVLPGDAGVERAGKGFGNVLVPLDAG